MTRQDKVDKTVTLCSELLKYKVKQPQIETEARLTFCNLCLLSLEDGKQKKLLKSHTLYLIWEHSHTKHPRKHTVMQVTDSLLQMATFP